MSALATPAGGVPLISRRLSEALFTGLRENATVPLGAVTAELHSPVIVLRGLS